MTANINDMDYDRIITNNSMENMFTNSSVRITDFDSVGMNSSIREIENMLNTKLDADEFRSEFYPIISSLREEIEYLEQRCEILEQTVFELQEGKEKKKRFKDNGVNVNDFLL